MEDHSYFFLSSPGLTDEELFDGTSGKVGLFDNLVDESFGSESMFQTHGDEEMEMRCIPPDSIFSFTQVDESVAAATDAGILKETVAPEVVLPVKQEKLTRTARRKRLTLREGGQKSNAKQRKRRKRERDPEKQRQAVRKSRNKKKRKNEEEEKRQKLLRTEVAELTKMLHSLGDEFVPKKFAKRAYPDNIAKRTNLPRLHKRPPAETEVIRWQREKEVNSDSSWRADQRKAFDIEERKREIKWLEDAKNDLQEKILMPGRVVEVTIFSDAIRAGSWVTVT